MHVLILRRSIIIKTVLFYWRLRLLCIELGRWDILVIHGRMLKLHRGFQFHRALGLRRNFLFCFLL